MAFFKAMFSRGLLLASKGEISEEALDLLSNVPVIEDFYGALRDTPLLIYQKINVMRKYLPGKLAYQQCSLMLLTRALEAIMLERS